MRFICVWDLPIFTENNKECTSGTHDILIGTHQSYCIKRDRFIPRLKSWIIKSEIQYKIYYL